MRDGQVFARPRLSMSPALNAMHHPGIETLFKIKDLAAGSLPHHLWHTVIHEYTHHWEFSGPVGTALNVLYLRQCQAIADGVAAERPVEDLIRLTHNALFINDVALGCLQPMAEALALYAEHDLTPSPSIEVESTVLSWAANLFTSTAGVPSDEIGSVRDERLARFLQEARLSVNGIERKADLLAEPFDEPTEEDSPSQEYRGYLGAYLYLKALQRGRLRDDPRLLSGCVLLMLVRRLFFDDYVLVDVLLDSLDARANIYDVAGRITQVIAHRLKELLAGDLPTMIDDVIEEALNGQGLPSPVPSGRSGRLDDGSSIEQRWESGVARLRAAVDEIAAGRDEFSERSLICLAQREVFSLFRATFPAVTDNGLVVPRDLRLRHEFPLLAASEAGLDPDGVAVDVSYEVVVLPYRWLEVAIYTLDDKVVRAIPFKMYGATADAENIGRIIHDRPRALAEQRALAETWKNLDALVQRGTDGLTHKLAANMLVREQYQQNILRMALLMLTHESPSDGQPTPRLDSLLEGGSFLNAAGVSTLRQLAALTLVATSNDDRGDVEAVFRSIGRQFGHDWDLDRLTEQRSTADADLLKARALDWLGGRILLPWF